jgi:dolichyl-phosphate beta-glucosyltransferase
MKPFISVIIPNYNEQANLERGILADISKYLSKQKYGWEVIISDDGSTDQSAQIIKKFIKSHPNFRYLDNPHAGKPYALRSGINAARGEYILFTDMDQSTPIKELAKLIKHARSGSRVVIGSRGSRRKDSSLFRQLASLIFLLARRSILLPRIKDTQCGFKLFETKLVKDLFPQMRLFGRNQEASGWKVTAYDVELLYLVRKNKVMIQEVPVLWRDEDVSDNKSRNFIKESIEMFFEILRVRVNDLLGKYG